MMMKYRVHEVAKDLNIQNKEVIDTLQKYFGETKKHMTALTEEELNVVFETFTQEHQVKSLEEYFAQREKKEEDQPKEKEQAPSEVSASTSPAPEKVVPAKTKSAVAESKKNTNADKAPRKAVKPGKIAPVKPSANSAGNENKKPQNTDVYKRQQISGATLSSQWSIHSRHIGNYRRPTNLKLLTEQNVVGQFLHCLAWPSDDIS